MSNLDSNQIPKSLIFIEIDVRVSGQLIVILRVMDVLMAGMAVVMNWLAYASEDGHEDNADGGEGGNVAEDQVDKDPEVPVLIAGVLEVPVKHVRPDEQSQVEHEENPVGNSEQRASALVLELDGVCEQQENQPDEGAEEKDHVEDAIVRAVRVVNQVT